VAAVLAVATKESLVLLDHYPELVEDPTLEEVVKEQIPRRTRANRR